MLTAPQRRLLAEMEFLPKPDAKWAKKQSITPEHEKMKELPQRSGNQDTPVKPEHRGILGQPENPHAWAGDKIGRPRAKHRPTKTSVEAPELINLGQPYNRGLSDQAVGDDASLHPVSKKPGSKARLQGPSENPSGQTWTGFGNRFPGLRSTYFGL